MVLSAYGVALIGISDNTEVAEQLRNEAEEMMNSALPLLLRFLSDRQYEVPLSVSPFVSDLLRIVSVVSLFLFKILYRHILIHYMAVQTDVQTAQPVN